MKSVALTEGKKAYFYDLNRQPGIKRNFSPKIRHAAGLQQAAWDAGCGTDTGSRGRGDVAAGARCVTLAGCRVPSARDMFWLHKDICIEHLKETLQTG